MIFAFVLVGMCEVCGGTGGYGLGFSIAPVDDEITFGGFTGRELDFAVVRGNIPDGFESFGRAASVGTADMAAHALRIARALVHARAIVDEVIAESQSTIRMLIAEGIHPVAIEFIFHVVAVFIRFTVTIAAGLRTHDAGIDIAIGFTNHYGFAFTGTHAIVTITAFGVFLAPQLAFHDFDFMIVVADFDIAIHAFGARLSASKTLVIRTAFGAFFGNPLGHAVYFLAGFEGYAVCAAPLCAFDTRQTVVAFAAERAIFGDDLFAAAIAAHRDCAIVLTRSLAIGFFARIAFVLATAKFAAFRFKFRAFAISIRKSYTFGLHPRTAHRLAIGSFCAIFVIAVDIPVAIVVRVVVADFLGFAHIMTIFPLAGRIVAGAVFLAFRHVRWAFFVIRA